MSDFNIERIFLELSTIICFQDVTDFHEEVRSRFDEFFNVPEKGKCNSTATLLRQKANELYRTNKNHEALRYWNEAICFAEAGSEELAMGYANRSVVYYQTGKYELALYNIALAKQNHYPERLMPKLLAREQNCREKMDESWKKAPVTHLVVKDVNPRMPFLAKGVDVVNPVFGGGIVAIKDFGAGDVILSRKPLLTTIDNVLNYLYCNHCSRGLQHSLIPCPGCVYYMYCSEECLERDKKLFHRFECEAASLLYGLSHKNILHTARLFFFGLTLFKDNIQDMMHFCRKTPEDGGNPFAVDYRNYDPLEEFKELHKAHPMSEMIDSDGKKPAALLCNVFMKKSSLVQSIITTKDQQDFFLRSLLKYTTRGLIHSHMEQVGALCPVAYYAKHACDPNAMIVLHSGQAKMVLLRPVRAGEQIYLTYKIPCLEERFKLRCICVSCKPRQQYNWNGKVPPELAEVSEMLTRVVDREDVDMTTKMRACKLFVEKYPHHIYLKTLPVTVLQKYRKMLINTIELEHNSIERAEISAMVL